MGNWKIGFDWENDIKRHQRWNSCILEVLDLTLLSRGDEKKYFIKKYFWCKKYHLSTDSTTILI